MPDDERHAFAFGLERGENAQRTGRVAGEPRFGELEHVETRDVGDRTLNRIVIELAFGQEKTELLDLLASGEQVALGRLGEKLQGIAADALILSREPRGKPPRQFAALERLHRDGHAGAFEGGKPRAALCRAIQPRQRLIEMIEKYTSEFAR